MTENLSQNEDNRFFFSSLFQTLYFSLIKLWFGSCRLAAWANEATETTMSLGVSKFEMRTIFFFADSSDKWVVSLNSTFYYFSIGQIKAEDMRTPKWITCIIEFHVVQSAVCCLFFFLFFFFWSLLFRAALGWRRYCKWWHVCIPLIRSYHHRKSYRPEFNCYYYCSFFLYNCSA